MENINSLTHLTNQLTNAIKQLGDEEYCRPLKILQYASIGEHVRHIMGFLQCIAKNNNSESLSYDSRQRDPRMETSITDACNELRYILNLLNTIDENQTVTVYSNLDYSDEETNGITSSYGRELLYAFDHTVHHMAIIRIAFQVEFGGIGLDENFGVAPSTIRYKKSLCAQ